MNDDYEELRDMMKKTLALTMDTNRMVHKMRRAAMWGRIMQLVWWGVVIAVSGAAYYYYLEPYVNDLVKLYNQAQATSSQTPGFNQEVQQFFHKF